MAEIFQESIQKLPICQFEGILFDYIIDPQRITLSMATFLVTKDGYILLVRRMNNDNRLPGWGAPGRGTMISTYKMGLSKILLFLVINTITYLQIPFLINCLKI